MVDRNEYAKRLESQMQSRLDFVTSMLGIDDVKADMSDDEFEALAARVHGYLQVINDR